jgi:hypothetical protein
MVLEVRVSIVPDFVVGGQSERNLIVEVSEMDFFQLKILVYLVFFMNAKFLF